MCVVRTVFSFPHPHTQIKSCKNSLKLQEPQNGNLSKCELNEFEELLVLFIFIFFLFCIFFFFAICTEYTQIHHRMNLWLLKKKTQKKTVFQQENTDVASDVSHENDDCEYKLSKNDSFKVTIRLKNSGIFLMWCIAFLCVFF